MLLAACRADLRKGDGGPDGFGLLGANAQTTSGVSGVRALPPIARLNQDRDRPAYVEQGTGQFVSTQSRRQIEADASGQSVSLNFVDVDLQDFVRAVFDEVLKEAVVVDASLKGRITLRTPAPVNRTVAMDLIKQAIQAAGASLSSAGGINRVTMRGDQRAGKRFGESIRLVGLRYISADEAKSALAPFVQNGIEIAAGPSGQYLTLSGASADLDGLEEVLASLDVDQMKGMSFGLFPLKEAGATAVSNELNQMFNKEGERGFRSLPISRMNALLIMTPRANQLLAAQKWIGKLDRADRDGRKVYVYPIQNRRATEIAKVLGVVLEAEGGKKQDPSSPIAPSLTASTAGFASRPSRTATTASLPSPGPETAERGEGSPLEMGGGRGPRIVSDVTTNSIVVTASADEWRVVEAALRRLDVMAPQVLIEAIIAEVRLNDSLRHGVRWYFQRGLHGIGFAEANTLSTDNVPGFSYAFGIPQAKIAISALEQITDVEIVSSPALTVLDNQTARLQIGDQVPIATRSARSVVNPDAPTVNDIEFRDTGVILAVTPRVNASGLVVLDIMQEVSDVVPTTTSNLDSPTIRQRRVNSSVAVHSGREIILGGLMSANRNRGATGIPGLIEIPVLGNLFKSQGLHEGGRTELLVVLRPTVMGNRADIQNVTNEIKARMHGVRGAIQRPR